MKIMGIAGWSGSGKTTLLVRLIPELIRRGVTLSTIKHAHHSFDIDQPGKDSWRHRAAGATEVLISSASRWVLMHENRDAPEASLDQIVGRLTPVDLLLIEGFKHENHHKIEVWRPATGKPLLAAGDPNVVAVASDGPVAEARVPVLDLNDEAAVADFILHHCALLEPAA